MMKLTYLLLYLLTIAVSTASAAVAATPSDSLSRCITEIERIDNEIHSLQIENINLKSEISELNQSLDSKSKLIDSLENVAQKANQNIALLADSLKVNILSTRAEIQYKSDNLNHSIAKKSITGFWIVVAIGLVIGAIAVVFGKLLARRGNEVASLSAKADKLNEEIVNRLSSEMAEMQTLSRQIGAISNATGSNSDTEQKLIITLADRITFMEMTLYKMDSSVRGHKQLSKSIKQMKDNLLANGYELVDMLGKDYHEGMRVIANFVEDENLPAGKQVITGIIKPQINFNGKMIQSAQIQVSQNI